MQFILFLIQKYKIFLLFFVLELIAFVFTIQYHSYQKSKFINSANILSGGFYNNITSFRTYFSLEKENRILAKENSDLKNLLLTRKVTPSLYSDSINIKYKQKFKYIAAKIINNDFHKNNNYLTLNKGINDSITTDMAVVNSKGVVGIVTNTSTNYSSAISLLNTKFKINARLKNAAFFGTLIWDGKSTQTAQLNDIPRQAILKIGDTIITGGRSSIFPEGILIGEIEQIKYEHNRYEKVDIKLFNDIKNTTNVYLIKNLEKQEILKLEQTAHD